MFEVFNCQILTIKCIADLDDDVQIVFWMVDVTEQILSSPSSAKKVSFFFPFSWIVWKMLIFNIDCEQYEITCCFRFKWLLITCFSSYIMNHFPDRGNLLQSICAAYDEIVLQVGLTL